MVATRNAWRKGLESNTIVPSRKRVEGVRGTRPAPNRGKVVLLFRCVKPNAKESERDSPDEKCGTTLVGDDGGNDVWNTLRKIY